MTDFFRLGLDEQAKRFESAAHAALSHWNIENASLKLIKHRENAVFRVQNGGHTTALRLHRHGYHTDDELRSELQWMQALSAAGIMVPDVIPAASGELFVNYSADGLPGKLQIDLFEWIEGEQLGSIEEGAADIATIDATYSAIGELAARVHNQAENWQLPDGFVRHAWDAEGLAGENPFWGQFWKLAAASKSEARLLECTRDRLFAELSALQKNPQTYSLIHADFAPENVLVDGNDVRLIDFDDAGFGWHMFELATALYFVRGEAYFEQAKAALLHGYRLHRELHESDLETLPLHFLARGLSYVGWVHTRHETETARDITPMLLASACELAEEYLQD